MDRAGCHFLTRARFAGDQDVAAASGDKADHLSDVLHRWAGTDQNLTPMLFGGTFFDSQTQTCDEVVEIFALAFRSDGVWAEVLGSTCPDAARRFGNRAIAASNNDRNIWSKSRGLFKHRLDGTIFEWGAKQNAIEDVAREHRAGIGSRNGQPDCRRGHAEQ